MTEDFCLYNRLKYWVCPFFAWFYFSKQWRSSSATHWCWQSVVCSHHIYIYSLSARAQAFFPLTEKQTMCFLLLLPSVVHQNLFKKISAIIREIAITEVIRSYSNSFSVFFKSGKCGKSQKQFSTLHRFPNWPQQLSFIFLNWTLSFCKGVIHEVIIKMIRADELLKQHKQIKTIQADELLKQHKQTNTTYFRGLSHWSRGG